MQTADLGVVLEKPLPIQNQIQIIDLQNQLSISECYGTNGCVNLRLYKIKFPDGQNLALKMLCGIISMFNNSINVTTEKMSGADIYEVATYIYTNYPLENIEDLILCLKMAKSGAFGKIYNRVDSMVILQFWKDYQELKLMDFERGKMEEKSNTGSYRDELDTEMERQRKMSLTESERQREIIASKSKQILNLNEVISNIKD